MKEISKIFLLNPKKEVLLCLRDNKPEIPYPNYWAEIGGEIENNETPLRAVKREINEEISCRVHNISFLGEAIDYLSNCKIFYFKGNFFEELKNIKFYEGQKIRIFAFEELNKLLLPPTLKTFILKNKDKIFS